MRIAVLVWTFALAAAAGVVAVVVSSDHASGKISILALTVPTGLAFITGGLIARTRRPENRSGLLLIAAGFASFVTALKTADDAVMFSLGHALQWTYFGFVVHVVLGFPSGRVGAGLDRSLVGAGYVLSFAMLPLLMAFGEAHLSCDRGACPNNLLSVGGGHDIAAVLDQTHLWVALAVAVAVLVQLGRRWRRARAPLRRAIAPVFASFGVLIVILGAQHVAEASRPQALDVMNWLLLAALLAVPLSFLFGLFRSRFGRAVERLVVELARTRPGTVREALARALADPTLELAYCLGGDTFVDIEGRAAPLPARGSGRDATFVTGDRGTVAAIVHDESLTGDPLLEPVSAAAALAFRRPPCSPTCWFQGSPRRRCARAPLRSASGARWRPATAPSRRHAPRPTTPAPLTPLPHVKRTSSAAHDPPCSRPEYPSAWEPAVSGLRMAAGGLEALRACPAWCAG